MGVLIHPKKLTHALCIRKITSVDSEDVPLPSNEYLTALTVLAFDNIDRQGESLGRGGTSYEVMA